MSLTRGLILIAVFASTWGLLAGLTIAFCNITLGTPLGIPVFVVSIIVAFFAALVLFGILDRFLIRGRKTFKFSSRSEKERSSARY